MLLRMTIYLNSISIVSQLAEQFRIQNKAISDTSSQLDLLGKQTAIKKSIDQVVEQLKTYSNLTREFRLNHDKESKNRRAAYFESVKKISLKVLSTKVKPSELRYVDNLTFFQAINKECSENFHSDYLAALLNHRVMGKFSFELLREILKAANQPDCQVSQSSYLRVNREKSLKQIDDSLSNQEIGERRIDLLIRHNNFVLILENKINSNESENQTTDYFRIVEKVYGQISMQMDENIIVAGILLSPTKTTPQEERFVNITYSDLYSCLKKASEHVVGKFQNEFYEIYANSLYVQYIIKNYKYDELISNYWGVKNEK